MSSIRQQLLRTLSLAALLLIGPGALLLLLLLRGWYIAQLDADLLARARILAGYVDREGRRYEMDLDNLQLPEYRRSDSGEFFEVRLAGGELLGRSASAGRAGLPLPVLKPGERRSFGLRLADGAPGRAAALCLIPSSDEPRPPGFVDQAVTILAARRTADLNLLLQRLGFGLALSCLLFMLLVWLMLPGLLRRGLRPLARLAHELDGIGSASLSKRLEPAGVPAELQPVYEHLNQMLERVAAGFEREQRLSADMAHELKTPLAELRVAAELAMRWPDDPECTRESFSDVRDTCEHMERVINALLLLARSQAGQLSSQRQTVDLAALLAREWAGIEAQLAPAGLAASMQSPPELQLHADPDLLTRILQNLLDNALRHSPPGGRIRCSLASSGGAAELRLSNSRGELGLQDLGHIFEPLWRRETARSQSLHAGLGLTLARELARALDGELNAALEEPDWFTITLRLPLSAA